MKKLLSILVAASFATVSVGAFAAAHGGAPKDKPAAAADAAKDAAAKMDACKKMDPKKADDKMKAECKAMMEKKDAKKEDKKADAPKK